MRAMLAVILATGLTVAAWGTYGFVLHKGQDLLGVQANAELEQAAQPAFWRAYLCVGVAYFFIAVLVPAIWLTTKGEQGRWSMRGIAVSLTAGALGALGALGIILAFKFGGRPIYVMPLVFGGAPVINTFVTMLMSKSYKEAGSVFYAGLILVVAGAVTVMVFKPAPPHAAVSPGAAARAVSVLAVALSIALTAFCWGTYGSVLHKGQAAMGGSRLRPLMCVGAAYFLIAVIVPIGILTSAGEPGQFGVGGTTWGLLAGSCGALGALGIILAFTFGGKPIYVMPLVFGGAPVINTFVTVGALVRANVELQVSPVFYAGLIVVVVGAVTVLVFAPKPGKKPPASKQPPAEPKAEPRAEEAPA